MPELERLRDDHAAAVEHFERANRAYFAAVISDRGDDYFEHFTARYQALLADQEAGNGAYHVVVDEDGSVLGRFNLIFTEAGSAELGYRVAEHAAGQGLATAAVLELCRLASSRYGLRRIRAAVSVGNAASRKVLTKAGFRLVGPADPSDIGGAQGSWYERVLEDTVRPKAGVRRQPP